MVETSLKRSSNGLSKTWAGVKKPWNTCQYSVAPLTNGIHLSVQVRQWKNCHSPCYICIDCLQVCFCHDVGDDYVQFNCIYTLHEATYIGMLNDRCALALCKYSTVRTLLKRMQEGDS